MRPRRSSILVLAAASCGRLHFGDGARSDAWNDATGDDSDVTGDTGDAQFVGSWSTFSPATSTTNSRYAIKAFSASDIFMGGADAGLAGEIVHFDGTSWSALAGPANEIEGLWGPSGSDVWEVGVACEVQHWDGGAWTPSTVTGCGAKTLFAVSGIAASDMWTAGQAGTVFHYAAGTWTGYPQGTSFDFRSTLEVSASEAYFGASKGVIKHWKTSLFADESIVNNQTINGLWAASATDVWGAAQNGVMIHTDGGGTWTTVQTPVSDNLYAVSGRSATDVWVVGQNGAIVHYDGMQWMQVTSPTTMNLYALAPLPNGRWIAGGAMGTLIAYQ